MTSPRIAFLLALIPTLLFGIAGCGTSSKSFPALAQSSSDITGSWLFAGAGAKTVLAAGLSEKTGAITGVGTVYGCSGTSEQTTLHGTVSSGGELTLETGALVGGASLAFHGQLNTDGKSFSKVTLDVSGTGCSLSAVQALTAQAYAPAQGNYTGHFIGADGASIPVMATLSQSSNAGPGGGYALSGSVSFPTSTCLNTAMIDSAQSLVSGGALSATYVATVAGQTVTITAVGTVDANAVNIGITKWTIAGGSCDGYSGTGSLID